MFTNFPGLVQVWIKKFYIKNFKAKKSGLVKPGLFLWLEIAFFVIIILTRSVYMETSINLYQKLWAASDDLRSQMDANEYKN